MRLRGERDLLSGTRGPGRPTRSALAVLAGATLWGTAGASQALLADTFPPATVGALRTAVGGLALGALAVVLRRPTTAPATAATSATAGTVPAAGRAALLLAGVALVGYQLGFFVGVAALGIAVGTLLAVGSAPFFAGVVAVATGTERPSRRWTVATGAAVVGLALLIRPDGGTTVDGPGVAAALLAGLSFGTFTVVSKRLLAGGRRHVDTVAVPFLLAAVAVLPLLAATPAVRDVTTWSDPTTVAVVAWLGLGATAAGYLLFIVGLRGVPAVVGATLVLMEPLTATLLGVGAFGERLPTTGAVGALLVAAALLATAVGAGTSPAGTTPTDPQPAR